MLGDYRLSLVDADRAIEIASKNSEMEMILAGAYHTKGMGLNFLGNLSEALAWLNRAKDAFRKINDEDSVAKVSMEIAMVSRYLGKFTTAEEIYREILSYYQSTGNVVWQANLLNNLGVLHALSGEYETALNELERAIQYARMGGYSRLEAYALTSLGDLFKDIHSFKEATEAYQKARETIHQINDQFLQFYLMLVECEMGLLRGHIRRAEELLDIARGIAQEAGSDYEKYLTGMLAGRVAYNRKDYEQALAELVPAMEYFTGEGHHVEAVRSRFMVAATYFQLDHIKEADDQINIVLPLVTSGELQNVLASAGEVLVDLIEIDKIPTETVEKIQPLRGMIDKVNKNLPQVRKLLRRQSQVVPLTPPELSIVSLGKIQVSLGDHVISGAEWKAQSARDLMLLLLLHPEGLTKEEVGMFFWPDSSPAELKLRYKNSIYRLRHAAGKDVIVFDDETYYFNHNMDYEADFESFKREFQNAVRAPNQETQLTHYLNATALYHGDFLPELNEDWVLAERQRLHQMYVDAMVRISEIHMENGKFLDTLSAVQQGLTYDPANENFYRLAMRANASIGNLAEVVKQYEKCVQELVNELGTEPSAQTQSLYKILTRQ